MVNLVDDRPSGMWLYGWFCRGKCCHQWLHHWKHISLQTILYFIVIYAFLSYVLRIHPAYLSIPYSSFEVKLQSTWGGCFLLKESDQKGVTMVSKIVNLYVLTIPPSFFSNWLKDPRHTATTGIDKGKRLGKSFTPNIQPIGLPKKVIADKW